MTKKIPIVEQTLEQLGINRPDQVEPLFKQVCDTFDGQASLHRDEAGWHTLRWAWLGRKSGALRKITENWLNTAPRTLKPAVGRALNALRAHIEATFEARRKELQAAATAVAAEALDLTLPGLAARRGTRHLISQTLEEISDIFARIGFSVVEGPEVETDYYNFEALNIPEHHPARDIFDTLYLDLPAAALPAEVRGSRSDPNQLLLLRTHTSPVQIRIMEKQKPPVRVIVPGKVYRHDNPDASHSFMFHQVEGLAVDRTITFSDLKGTLDYFLREFFGPQTKTRFVPSYFPFTEPSADVHGSCHVCGGAGCRVCKFTGWIELCGCGMVHPAVFDFVGYDPDEFSGFAFGMGLDRFAMLKYGIDDIQLFFQNDVRFLQQFRR